MRGREYLPDKLEIPVQGAALCWGLEPVRGAVSDRLILTEIRVGSPWTSPAPGGPPGILQTLDRRIASHVGIAERYAASTKEGRLLGSGPVDALIRTSSGPGWALVGDAAMNQDPWSGLGMDNAGIHATFLAEAVAEWLSGRSHEVAAFATYRERRDEHALAGFDFTANVGRDLRALAGD